MKEHDAFSMSGGLAILLGLALLFGGPGWAFAQIPQHQLNPAPYLGIAAVFGALGILVLKGCFIVDPERKAAMVSNLLVVLCGERSTQPVVNAGTLY